MKLRVFSVLVLSMAVVGMSLADDRCTVLPPEASEQAIKVAKMRLLAEVAQDQVEISGRTRIEDHEYQEDIQRVASGYVDSERVLVFESNNTQIKICIQR